MEKRRGPRWRPWWGGVIGVCAVVAAMIAVLCLLQLRSTEPPTVDTSVPGLAGATVQDPAADSDAPVVGYRVGDVAPPFSLPSLSGEPMSLAAIARTLDTPVTRVSVHLVVDGKTESQRIKEAIERELGQLYWVRKKEKGSSDSADFGD